jgi:hypothetical protein
VDRRRFALTGGTQARLAVRQPIDKTLRVAEWRELASAPFTYDTKTRLWKKFTTPGFGAGRNRDGRDDVVLVRDFKLQVLDGRTVAVKKWVWMPPMPAEAKPRPYELYSGDSIVFASLTAPGRRDILLKDRYQNFWAFSRDLQLLSPGSDATGHYPPLPISL